MSWVKIDDQFYDHPKVACMDETLRLPAVGLYVFALCWANARLTDGFIPESQVSRLVGDISMLLPRGTAQPLVDVLVDVGLWEVVDGGYLIHDYLDYQASKKQVEEERGRARERMANVRENKKRSSGEVQANKKRSSGEVRVTPHPHKDLLSSSPDGVHLELHSEFDSFWSAYPRKEGKGQAKRAWAGALRKAPPDVVRAGLAAQLPSLAARERQYIPLPATWLNGERWGDEMAGNGKAPPSDPATWSLRKVFATHFFENHVWMCCELDSDEEREIREGIESGRITREEVDTWQ